MLLLLSLLYDIWLRLCICQARPTLNCTLNPSEVSEVFSMCSLTSNVHSKNFEWRAIDAKISFHLIWNERYYILEPFRVTMAPFSNVGEGALSFIVLKKLKSHKSRQFQHTLVDISETLNRQIFFLNKSDLSVGSLIRTLSHFVETIRLL